MTLLAHPTTPISTHFRNVLAKLSVAIIGVFISGCAINPEAIESKSDTLTGKGTIVFSVTHDNNSGPNDKLMVYLDDGVPILGIGNGAMFQSSERSGSLIASMFGTSTNSDFKQAQGFLMVASVAAGEHSFSNWQISDGNGLRIFPAKETPPLKFTVKTGSVTYLGNFHGHILRAHNIFGKAVTNNGMVEVRDERTRDLELLKARRPELSDKAEIELLNLGFWTLSSSKNTEKRIDPIYTPPTLK